MAKRVVSFSLAQGRRDRVDPKLAPFGVLAVAKNLRVRKDGRLGCRYGYQPLQMGTNGGTLKAYDLVEYQGRLVAFGAHSNSGFPERPYEYTGLSAGGVYWRYETDKRELTPFVDFKDLTIASPPISGVDMIDTAAGGGYVLTVFRSTNLVVTAIIVRESDNQPIWTEVFSTTQLTRDFRCTFAVDTFYVGSQRADNSINILKFTVGTSTAWASIASLAANATRAVFDIAPVENPTTGRIAFTRDRGTSITALVRIYDSTGTVVGTDISYGSAADNTIATSIAADQTANVIHVLNVLATGAVQLRSFNFAGTVLNSTTSGTSGIHGTICRIPATAAAGAATQVAVVIGTNSFNTIIEYYLESAYTLTATTSIFQAVATTRVIPWTSATSTNANSKYSVVFGGYVCPDITTGERASNALFFSAFGASNAAHMALRDFTHAIPGIYDNMGLHLDASTGRVTWCAARESGSESAMPSVTTLVKNSSARRQTAKFGDLLYIAGAPMQVYDGRSLTEPFQEVPGILSATPNNGAGSLTPSGIYQYTVHWEVTLADGSFWQSAVSDELTVTLGATDDTVDLVCSTPHTLACLLNAAHGYGAEITEVISRTAWDGSSDNQLHRSVTDAITGAGNDYGATSVIEDITSDIDVRVEGAVYTQAGRAAASGVLEHNAPQASSFIAATESRLLTGGLGHRSQFQMSKDAFPHEPFTFSEAEAFFSQVVGALRGMASLDGARLVFTADEIFAFTGDGPDDLGGGAIGRAQDLPSPSGLKDWRSLLKAHDGLYFQLDDEKIYRLPRGGGAPEWIGIDVMDTLTAYPVITGAAKCRREDTIVFACENLASSDGRLLVRSMRTGIWTEDTAPLQTSQGIEAVVGIGDSLAYISGGTVYLQSTTSFADNTSTVIPLQWKTYPIYPFDLGGYGTLWAVLVTGEFRSAGTLALSYYYDNNVSAAGSFTISGLTVGQAFQRKWALQQSDFTSLIFEWTFTPSVAGEGVILHNASLLVESEEGLRELTALETA